MTAAAGHLDRLFFNPFFDFFEVVEPRASRYPPLYAPRQGHLLLGRQEPDLADLFQVRPHGVGAARTGDSDVELQPGHQHTLAAAERVVRLSPQEAVVVLTAIGVGCDGPLLRRSTSAGAATAGGLTSAEAGAGEAPLSTLTASRRRAS